MAIPSIVTCSLEAWDRRAEKLDQMPKTLQAFEECDLIAYKEEFKDLTLNLTWSDRDMFIYLMGRYHEQQGWTK